MKKIITNEMFTIINNIDMSIIGWIILTCTVGLIRIFIQGLKKRKIKGYLKIPKIFEGGFEAED